MDIKWKIFGFSFVKKLAFFSKLQFSGQKMTVQEIADIKNWQRNSFLIEWKQNFTKNFKIIITGHPVTTGKSLAVNLCWKSFLERWTGIFQEGIFMIFLIFRNSKSFWFLGASYYRWKKDLYFFSCIERELFGPLSKVFQWVVKTIFRLSIDTFWGNLNFVRKRTFQCFFHFGPREKSRIHFRLSHDGTISKTNFYMSKET